MTELTGLVVPFPGLEPIVGRWRSRFDAAVAGVGPHVTVLVPWIAPSQVRPVDLAAVGELARGWAPFEVSFTGFEMFDVPGGPDVHYLKPNLAGRFSRLTEDVLTLWPEHEPYGGQHGRTPIPHLTVSSTGDGPELEPMFADVNARLPITLPAQEIRVLEVRDGVCSTVATYPLGG